MWTPDEFKRVSSKSDGSMVLDMNLKKEILQQQMDEVMKRINEKLKRMRPGAKLGIFWSDLK